jgi:hypothetical protein
MKSHGKITVKNITISLEIHAYIDKIEHLNFTEKVGSYIRKVAFRREISKHTMKYVLFVI